MPNDKHLGIIKMLAFQYKEQFKSWKDQGVPESFIIDVKNQKIEDLTILLDKNYDLYGYHIDDAQCRAALEMAQFILSE